MKKCMYCGQENEDSSIVCAKCGNTLLDIPTDQMPPLEETHDEEPAPVQGTGPVIQDGQNASSGVVSSPDGQPLPDAAASGTVYPEPYLQEGNSMTLRQVIRRMEWDIREQVTRRAEQVIRERAILEQVIRQMGQAIREEATHRMEWDIREQAIRRMEQVIRERAIRRTEQVIREQAIRRVNRVMPEQPTDTDSSRSGRRERTHPDMKRMLMTIFLLPR